MQKKRYYKKKGEVEKAIV